MLKNDPVIIRTRLVPPLRESAMVERDRLLTRLSDSGGRSVIILKAPAGYGKTTLTGQWYVHLDPTVDLAAWYSLDATDNDLGRFFSYLVAALRVQEHNFGGTILTQLNAGVRLSSASLCGSFLNEIAEQGKRVNIVLDDFHVLHNAEIISAMSQIISNAPANLRLVIASRETPALPLGRLRGLGRVIEITGEELRFRGPEIGSFLSLAGQTKLSAGQIHAVEKHTEGWATGLQLASISLSNRDDVSEFISTLSGSYRDVADFLVEDVLQRLDQDTRGFLLQTSILERLSPSLCDSVTGTQTGRQMLDRLESKSLFLFRLDNDGEWYRYHHLFSEFLRKYLESEQADVVVQLHIRASDWFAGHGFIEEAIQHALAGKDVDRAARFLNRACDDLFYSGRLNILAEWYKQIPEVNLHQYPRILLDQAWSVILEWKFPLARRMLDTVHAILRDKEDLGDAEGEVVFLHSMLKHREMMYALFRDDMPLAARLCKEMLQDFPLSDPYLRGNLYTCLIYAQREMFVFNDVDRFDALSAQLYEEANSSFVLIWHNSILGPTERDRGHLDRAEETLVLARSIASEISGGVSPLAAMPGILLAEILYERNQLEEADTLLNQYLPLADQLGFVDQLIAGYICRARLLKAAGTDKQAEKVLREGEALAIKMGFSRFSVNIEAEYVRQALLDRDFEAATQVFERGFRATDVDSLYPGNHATTLAATKAITWCRLARIEGLLDEVSTVCRKWIRFTRHRGAVRTTIQFNLLLAHILQQQGDTRASTRTLREALVSASSAGFIRTVIDELGSNISLLDKFIERQGATDDPVLNYANQLVGIVSSRSGCQIPVSDPTLESTNLEQLSEREREILQMVAAGLLNREIADSLCLTEGSIKWYLQQIYDKVGTRRRAQAVQRARDLGLIK